MPYTYGRSPNDYVEVPVLNAQGQPTGQVQRPAAGVAVLVRDAETDAAQPSTLTQAYGYLSFTATPPIVEVSADGGSTWKTLFGVEALGAAVASGQTAQQALTAANSVASTANAANTKAQTALDTANLALQTAGQGGGAGGFTWENAPAGTLAFVQKRADGTWPARYTDRQDVYHFFRGWAPFPAKITTGVNGYYENVDTILETPAP